MFVIIVSYLKPIEDVDKFLLEHRAFLELGYQKNYFIASGPQNPRTGGIILSQLKNKKELENILSEDPFSREHLAHYNIIEFEPVKYHQDFATFV
jgi:uncharacterized protein YciI